MGGFAQYSMIKYGMSWYELVNGPQLTVTGERVKKGGGIKSSLMHNNRRSQSLYGDLFIDDHSQALVVNKGSGWGAAVNKNRIATTLSNNNYGHTFAGMGGHHEHGAGSWITHYEMAPISPYCSLRRGYGNSRVYGRGDAYMSSCRYSFTWVNLKYSLYVR